MRADCHIHMVLDGFDWKQSIARHQPEPDSCWIRSTLETYREKGYTYLFACFHVSIASINDCNYCIGEDLRVCSQSCLNKYINNLIDTRYRVSQ